MLQQKCCATPDMDPASAGFHVHKDGFIYYKDSPLYLPPKERGSLQLLLRSWPQAVPKSEFARHAWAGRMSDDSLRRCIKQLRHALLAIASVQIESLYRSGYRLRISSGDANASAIVPQSIHPGSYDTVMAQPASAES